MKIIKKNFLKTAIIGIMTVIGFTSCSNLTTLFNAESSDSDGITITVTTPAARTVTPYDFTTDKLNSITDWGVTIIIGSQVNSYSVSGVSNGVISLHTNITGTADITVLGSYIDGDDIVSVEGTTSAELTSGVNVPITVDTVKCGEGSLNLALKLDDLWGINSTTGYLYKKGFTSYTAATTGATAGESTTTETNDFTATLTSLTTKEAVELTVKILYQSWTNEGTSTSGNEFKYFMLTGSGITAGTYKLSFTATCSDDTTITFPLSDSIVEIFDDKETSDEITSYCFLSTSSIYYATNNNADCNYNGLSSKSRINLADLITKSQAKGLTELSVYFTEDELSSYKTWDIWSTWTQPLTVTFYPDGESTADFTSNDFYMGRYRTVFVSDSDDASSTNTGLESESPLDISSVTAKITGTDYTVNYTISDTDNYSTSDTNITATLAGLSNPVNIVVNQTGSSTFTGWTWPETVTVEDESTGTTTTTDSQSYTLTLGSGITTGAITADEGARLTALTFGEDYTTVPASAFQDTNISSLTFGSNVESIGKCAFNANPKLTNLVFGDGLKYIYGDDDEDADPSNGTFGCCPYIESITFDDALESIGPNTFGYCDGLTTLNFGSGLKTIDTVAFDNCTSLTTLDFSNTKLETIGEYAFAACTALTDIDFGDSITCIGAGAFSGASKLETFTLPENTDTNKWMSVTSSGSASAVTDFTASNLLSILTGGNSLERCTVSSFDVPFVVWSGVTSDSDSSYNKFYISNSTTKYGALPIGDAITEVVDFTFDSDGNLWTVEYVSGATSSYRVCRYVYDSTSGTYSQSTIISSTSSEMKLYYERDADLVYVRDATQLKAYKASDATLSTTYSGKNTLTDFAVTGILVFDYQSDGTLSYNGSLDAENESFVANTSSCKLLTDVSDYSTNMTVTDMTIVDGYAYVLVSARAQTYSRGGVLKFTVNSDGTLTYVKSLGLYTTNTAFDATSDSTLTAETFLSQYFTAPVKFVATEPKKLVIADDGGYYYETASGAEVGDVNRIVTVDLTKFAIESSVNAGATFEKTATFLNGGCDFSYFGFE